MWNRVITAGLLAWMWWRRPETYPVTRSALLLLSYGGLVFFWLDNRNHFAHRFGPEINDAEYLRQAVAILERGLAADSDQCGATPAPPSA